MNSFMPVSDSILNAGFSLYGKVSVLLIALVGTIFLMRIVSLQLKFAGIHEYGTVLKDIVLYFALISLFPYLVRMIFASSELIASKIAFLPVSNPKIVINEFFGTVFYDSVFMKVISRIGDVLVINLAQSVFSILVAVLLSIAPIFIFISTVLGFQGGIGLYFNTIIATALWPVVWNLIGLIGKEIFNSNQQSTMMTIVCFISLQVLQLLSPLFSFILLRTLSTSGVTSKLTSMAPRL
ncbi:MAG: hypothetical protein H7235_06080 [Bdellovibrionaceae bacterium]|nr:hypothetical protein [Pseudobdellovibrionaceae bacterium]